jgi:hypothetical protein
MASTSSLPLLHVWTKGNVFLRFRGTNTRKSLTSLIFTTLCVKTKLMLASLINLMEEIDRACPLGNDWRVIYFDRHFLRKLCRFYTFFEGTHQDCWVHGEQMTDGFTCFLQNWSRSCSRSDWELWRCTLQAWKTMRMLWWNFFGSSGLFYLLPSLSLICSWFIMHCMQGWDQAN